MVRELFELHGIGVQARVGVVDTIDAFGHEHNLGIDFQRTLRCARIRGEGQLNGKTVGYSVLGIKVVSREGSPITPGHAAIRVLVLPISVISVIGVLGIIFDPKQRALHDFAAKTAVVYDWGDRPAEMPSPLTNWLVKKGVVRSAAPEVKPAVQDSAPS